MHLCRCGHGRHTHRQTRNAISKRRARGLRPTGRQACHATVAQDGRQAGLGFVKCGCRDYVPQEVKP